MLKAGDDIIKVTDNEDVTLYLKLDYQVNSFVSTFLINFSFYHVGRN
jgi:hypothetical protein